MEKKRSASNIRSKLAEALDSANQEPKDTQTSSTMTTTEILVPSTSADAPVTLSPEKIINGSVLLAAGAGAIPVPLWDSAVLFGVQLKMLADLSAAYGKPFDKNIGKSAVAALLGGMAPGLIARGAVGGLLKTVPGVGSILGTLAQPAFAAAVTYGVGKVFVKHYESGGTLLTFNAKEFKDTFTAEVKTGMKKVSEFKY
ncbi:MAG: hypothetical protein WCA95_14555 [Opitutaceae bacterium]|jgi:uncharacterized protein (DUF697 family)